MGVKIGDTSIPNYKNTDFIGSSDTFIYSGINSGQVNLITLANTITVTFGAPTNIQEGATYTIILKASDTSLRTFAWATNYKFPNGSPTLTNGTQISGGYDIITFLGMPGNIMLYRGHISGVYS